MCFLRAGSAWEAGWTRKVEVLVVVMVVVMVVAGLATGTGCTHQRQLEEWELADGTSGWEHLSGRVHLRRGSPERCERTAASGEQGGCTYGRRCGSWKGHARNSVEKEKESKRRERNWRIPGLRRREEDSQMGTSGEAGKQG